MTTPSNVVNGAMVVAGLRVLRESGLVDHEGSGDWLTVKAMLETALAAREGLQTGLPMSDSESRILALLPQCREHTKTRPVA